MSHRQLLMSLVGLRLFRGVIVRLMSGACPTTEHVHESRGHDKERKASRLGQVKRTVHWSETAAVRPQPLLPKRSDTRGMALALRELCLDACSSTVGGYPLSVGWKSGTEARGGTERTRTSDTWFRKPLLYPLSYSPGVATTWSRRLHPVYRAPRGERNAPAACQ